jgi:predicted ATPase/class 3 adenylate cyclase
MVEASLGGDAVRTIDPGTAVPRRTLPSGMVTFVFTDIEGSTRLLRRWGSQYEELLERHRDILRAAWNEHRGCEIGAEGDAFLVAFERADDAIEACAAAQRGLLAEPWPQGGVVRVRMGVHSGLAWPRGDNYVALAVHQAARVVCAAHGGQVIATSDAAERAEIPVLGEMAAAPSTRSPEGGAAGTEFVALGRFRVRDFDEPVQILQVVGPGIPTEFPSLRVLPADRHNLVAPPNELFGRETDLSELESLISKSNLVTLVGPGGVGKTRLATEFGLCHATEWGDGAWLVDLTGVRDGSLVPEAIAAGIGVKTDGDTEPWDADIDYLRTRHALLLVDNCEHLRVDVARRLSELLHECPGVSVLATSREPLGLREERVCRTEPIATDSAAVAMFAQRAGIAEELGDLDSSTRTTLEELCRVLDGLPLAIELAASRCDVLSPSEILTQLKNQRSLLRSQDPTLAERQRSMEATIEWSRQLLDEHEQTAFRRLGVFADGFDLNAATMAVFGEIDASTTNSTDDGLAAFDVPELVWSLTSKSLVTSEVASGTTRYRMLETIRAHSMRLLDRSRDTEAVAADVGRFYLESFGPHLMKFDASLIADRAREVNNLRALISMLATSNSELAQMIASMVVADVRQTSFRAAIEEGRGFLEQLAAPTQGRVWLLNNVAFTLDEAQLPEQALVLITEAESLAATAGLPSWLEGRLEQERGIVEIIQGNPGRAREIALDGLTRATSDRARANLLELLLLALIDLGDYRAAIEAGDEALAISQERGDLELVSLLLSTLAEASWRLGDHPAAAGRQLESLSLGMQTGRRRDIAYACIMAARLADAETDYATAARLQGAADRLLDEAGASLYPADAALRLELLEGCRDRLGDEAFSLELAAGAALEIQEAVGVARQHLELVAGSDFDTPQ